ncbi:MAG: glycosyltransferase [Balneolales bacterium]
MNKPRKIAYLVGRFPVISETFVINQITALLDKGYQIDIYATKRGKLDLIQNGVSKYNLVHQTRFKPHTPYNSIKRFLGALYLMISQRPPGEVLRNLFNFMKHGRQAVNLSLFYETVPFWPQKSYDIILCHFGPNGSRAVAMRELGLIKGPIVTIFHGFDITHYVKMFGLGIYRQLFEKGELFLTVSDLWRKKLLSAGVDKKRLMVHRVGVQTEKFIYHPPEPLLQKPVITLLSVGRLVEKKGIEYGIRAIEHLLKKKYAVKYVILGDGILKEELQSLISSKNLNGQVVLEGACNQDKVHSRLKEADIVLVPSVTALDGDMEGIPVILMEAMAAGVPVVATDHSGIPELVKNNLNGYLVEERNAGEIAEKVEYIIHHPDQVLATSRRARLTIEESFNASIQNRRLELILNILYEKPLFRLSNKARATISGQSQKTPT